jgi:hypothetical protein
MSAIKVKFSHTQREVNQVTGVSLQNMAQFGSLRIFEFPLDFILLLS